MSLPRVYTQAFGLFAEFFGKIRDAQAPEKFTQQQLIDFGYTSSNHRPFIPLLKTLGFLSPDGTPTQRYHDYRNHASSKRVMGEAIKDAYADIFLIKEFPTVADKPQIEGKFKSFHNVSDTVAKQMMNTFYSLLDLADLNRGTAKKADTILPPEDEKVVDIKKESDDKRHSSVGLHYNIQIHLPATKDVEVYNAIFKSLKEHLIG